DPRMQPWLTRVMGVAKDCYDRERKADPNATGVIALKITMHENARPDADVKTLPAQLSGLVPCATGQLMRARMPLFTGPEGQSHTIKIHFE
ncbi:MAG TPA: hypothetical protein VJV79_25950, partial [Polyangiaceae bacterium]|nr:hypothetical protein [Polyangiaceae bacterium]